MNPPSPDNYIDSTGAPMLGVKYMDFLVYTIYILKIKNVPKFFSSDKVVYRGNVLASFFPIYRKMRVFGMGYTRRSCQWKSLNNCIVLNASGFPS